MHLKNLLKKELLIFSAGTKKITVKGRNIRLSAESLLDKNQLIDNCNRTCLCDCLGEILCKNKIL